jgi:predicted dienelactone hydrolase
VGCNNWGIPRVKLSSMKLRPGRWACLLVGFAAVCTAQTGSDYKPAAGPFPIKMVRLEWVDGTRNRSVPVKIYGPDAGKEACPVIIFSHGLGGTREGYEYLGRYWAAHGYVSVHLQHEGSDDTAWRGRGRPMQAMREAAADPLNAINRPLDVRFAIDQIIELNSKPGPFQGRLDINRIGMAGHSFGAFTTLAVAGQVFGPGGRSGEDSRVKAAIAMSAPVPRANRDRSYSQIRIPIFHMTGTEDNSPIGDTQASERRIPFDCISGADQYLLTFQGGDHMVFSGRSGFRGDRSKDELFHSLILQGSTAFWDAYLKGEAGAKKWLFGDFEKAVGGQGRVEKRVSPDREAR